MPTGILGSHKDQNSEQYQVKNTLSYDDAVIEWITSGHKNRMTTRVITLWRVYVPSLTTSVSTMSFLTEIMLLLKAVKSHF